MTTDPGAGRFGRWAEGFRTWVPLLISICAISLTIFQASAARKHTRLSVAPKLDWRVEHDSDTGAVTLKMVNVGFGPAAVTDIILHHDATPVGRSDSSTCERLDALLGRDGEDWETACFAFEGEYYLRQGDEVVLYASRPAARAHRRPAHDVDALRIRISARYCSFYDECWWLNGD